MRHLSACHEGTVATISVDTLRAALARRDGRSAASRARTAAALNSFLTWAVRHDLLVANPLVKLDRVQVPEPAPRGVTRAAIDAILATIPRDQLRDQLLFRMLAETGLRISEALQLEVDDLDLTPDDEHLHVLGKRGQRRTVLLDAPQLVRLLRRYLKAMQARHGPLFRPLKNGDGLLLQYQTLQERWARYCATAGVVCTLHQLRHSHATALVQAGVSLATIRKRLGHKHIQTTLRYAEQSDTAADAELRARRRHQR
ncbi:MAG: site-specific integrase [Roseiflexaceae bacterium]|nr:site-specific integrase [Roseiflexaceae bacterium]